MGSKITLKYEGSFLALEKKFYAFKNIFNRDVLEEYGKYGVEKLYEHTPKDTGKTAESWYYEINNTKDGSEIVWKNSNVNKGVNIALIIQYGHGMPNGTYVQGIDYINPSLQEVFNHIAEDARRRIK